MKCIGLVTDFGDSPYTGVLRAVIKSMVGPDACLIDIDHSIPSYNNIAGGYVVANTYRWMPKGSIIVAVIDPGVGSARMPIAVNAGDYTFIGPNNGVLYPAIAREGFRSGVELSPTKISTLASNMFSGKLPRGRWTVSYTFHGRDLFAPAAALLAMGYSIEGLGDPISFTDLAKITLDYVERDNSGFKVMVTYIDKFGNVALSVREHMLPLRLGDSFIIEASGTSYRVMFKKTFSDVSPGDLVAYINSFGYLEIAVNQGNAANKLGLEIGERIRIHIPAGELPESAAETL